MNQDGTSLSLQPTIKAHISQWPEEAGLLDCVATDGVISTQHPGKWLQHRPETIATKSFSLFYFHPPLIILHSLAAFP